MSQKNANSPDSLLVAGGGTGGHVLAGVAIAEAWSATHPGSRVVFVGASGAIEEKLVPRAGFPLFKLKLGSLKGAGMSRTLRTLLQLPVALWTAGRIFLTEKPSAVIGVGGYASGPVVLMARLLRFRHYAQIAILEQNAVPGFTNRLLSRYADLVLCAFPGIDKRFPTKPTVITGNPVRKQITPMRTPAPDPFTIFIFGGSQGALGINTLMLSALPHLQDLRSKIAIIHQTGEKDFERVRRAYESMEFNVTVEKFVYDMPEAYRRASLVVCRAGSSTLAEVAAVGRAAVLIPFPHASDNHQEMNARLFTDAGAAKLLIQGKARGEDLAKLIRHYIGNPDELRKMEKAVTKFYRPKAALDVVTALHMELA